MPFLLELYISTLIISLPVCRFLRKGAPSTTKNDSFICVPLTTSLNLFWLQQRKLLLLAVPRRYSHLHICVVYVIRVILTSRCISDAVCVWLYVYACLLHERWVYVLYCVASMYWFQTLNFFITPPLNYVLCVLFYAFSEHKYDHRKTCWWRHWSGYIISVAGTNRGVSARRS